MAEPASKDTLEAPSVGELKIAETPGAATTAKATEQEITPWDVNAGTDEHGNALEFDYHAISQRWATSLIDQALLDRFERLTGKKPHRWLRRRLFFSHRDFELILDCYERGDPFLLYTGRGPSAGSLHIGHTIPFEFTKWLQDVFDVPLVIMLTDDEKALFKEGLTFEDVLNFARENARDIIAMGFDIKKTFIYSDLKYVGGHILMNAWEFSKLVTFNQVRGAFGFDGSTNCGRIFFPSLQCVAAFATSYPHIWGDDPDSDFRSKKTASIPCLIPCAIDQDPYFRLVRDNCLKMGNPSPKPALIHSKFLTSLLGPGGKMSASNPNSAIYMSDSAAQIKKKINKYAFSGGQETVELHREKGGNWNVDVAAQYLGYFDDDDEKLAKLSEQYKKGELLTGELKAMCIQALQEYVMAFQERRKAVTDEVLKSYMTPRKLEWNGNPNPNLELKAKYDAQLASEGKKKKKAGKVAKGGAAK